MTPAPEIPPLDERPFRRFLALQLLAGAVIAAGGAAVLSLDFALGALVGSTVVGVNLIWTKNAVRQFVQPHRPRPAFLVFYAVKFTVSLAMLYVAIALLQIDITGILAGVCSLLAACAAAGAIRLRP